MGKSWCSTTETLDQMLHILSTKTDCFSGIEGPHCGPSFVIVFTIGITSSPGE